MRLFEILVVTANGIVLLSLGLGGARSRSGSLVAATVVLLPLAVHLLWEGSRWQMIPAYLASAALFGYLLYRGGRVRQNGQGVWSRSRFQLLGCILGLLAQAGAAALSLLLPVPKLLVPTGPFSIGTTSYHWIDRSRTDPSAPDPGSPRELMVRVWYPAESGQQIAPSLAWPTIDALGPAIAGTKGAPSFVLSHLRHVRSHALPQARPASSQQRYRVILFSHGLGSVPEMNTFLIEELASHGYIVVGVNHTYSSAASVFPDGRVARYQASLLNDDMPFSEHSRAADRLVEVWAADLRFVLDQVTQLNQEDPQGLLTGHLDLSRIGGAGYSFGGAAVAEASYLDPRLRAGVAIDSTISGRVAEGQLQQPFMLIKSAPSPSYEQLLSYGVAHERARLIADMRLSTDNLFKRLSSQGYSVAINGTRHQNFSEASLIVPYGWLLGLTGAIDPRLALHITNEYTLALFDQTLNQRSAPLLEDGTTPYPQVEIESHADQERAKQ